jgi:hypothetical protein
MFSQQQRLYSVHQQDMIWMNAVAANFELLFFHICSEAMRKQRRALVRLAVIRAKQLNPGPHVHEEAASHSTSTFSNGIISVPKTIQTSSVNVPLDNCGKEIYKPAFWYEGGEVAIFMNRFVHTKKRNTICGKLRVCSVGKIQSMVRIHQYKVVLWSLE